jgi:D-glycero-D-manno-heptose 1,7-bisphosphate phosphatase
LAKTDNLVGRASVAGAGFEAGARLESELHDISRIESALRRKKARTAIFDRDGIINRIVMRDGAPASPRNMEEFIIEPEASAALARLKTAGFRMFVASNQPDLARSKVAPETIDAMTAAILAALPIEAVRICPHDDGDGCACRKPRPGMLLGLARDFGFDLSGAFMIGDTWKDVHAGRAAGCATILLARDYNRGVAADFKTATLSEAVDLILAVGDARR